MVNEPIPFDQRGTGFMEYRSGCQTDFITTRFAIKNTSSFDKPGFPVSTSGTLEAIRPSKISEMLSASFISGKFFLKVKQAALLVSFWHWRTSSKKKVLYLYDLSQ
jgi:hypothetical protein